MLKRLFHNLSRSFFLYLLTALNLFHAIRNNRYDWLLWASVALTALSLLLNIVCTIREVKQNGTV